MAAQEVGLEAGGAAGMEDFAEDHLQEKNESGCHIQYIFITLAYKINEHLTKNKWYHSTLNIFFFLGRARYPEVKAVVEPVGLWAARQAEEMLLSINHKGGKSAENQ